MRKLLTYLFLGCFLQINTMAQQGPLPAPASSGESIVLRSDREIYGLGEDIHFVATYEASEELQDRPWSSVLYVELISWDGSKQAASKVLIKNGSAKGSVRVPENIPSGVYYLRAYTLWMRNYSPLRYAYLPLKILNPYSEDLVAGPQEGLANIMSMKRKEMDVLDGIVISGLKGQYASREEVELEIQIPEYLRNGKHSLGIAKTYGPSSEEYSLESLVEAEEGAVKIEFLPEITGLTLSGRLVSVESNEPVPNTRMQLSSYANPLFFAEVPTGEDGSFLYSLPHFSGNPELHIMDASESGSDHNILLASEYCNKPILLPHVPLKFDSLEKSIVKEILINMQLEDRYSTKARKGDQGDGLFEAFYAKDATTTYVKDYIELSSLREFIYEIIPQVSIVNSNSASSISIQGPSCIDIYPPLVLMDNVPVPNNEELLNIPSARIERIEVLNQAYMVGTTRYSGILSVYSTKNDMSDLAHEGTRHFFNFHMLDNLYLENESLPAADSSSPDIRNLLVWDPVIHLSDEGSFRVNFSTPDIPGQYVLTLWGTDTENRQNVYKKVVFLVK